MLKSPFSGKLNKVYVCMYVCIYWFYGLFATRGVPVVENMSELNHKKIFEVAGCTSIDQYYQFLLCDVAIVIIGGHFGYNRSTNMILFHIHFTTFWLSLRHNRNHSNSKTF